MNILIKLVVASLILGLAIWMMLRNKKEKYKVYWANNNELLSMNLDGLGSWSGNAGSATRGNMQSGMGTWQQAGGFGRVVGMKSYNLPGGEPWTPQGVHYCKRRKFFYNGKWHDLPNVSGPHASNSSLCGNWHPRYKSKDRCELS
jgi:hypothetical protein